MFNMFAAGFCCMGAIVCYFDNQIGNTVINLCLTFVNLFIAYILHK